MKNKIILTACKSLDYLLISRILRSDFSLIFADTLEEILKLEESVQCDLLLVDIAFIRANSEVLKKVKKNRVPVIALSSEPGDARDRKLLEEGCNACYIRPIRQEVFLPFVCYWINQLPPNE